MQGQETNEKAVFGRPPKFNEPSHPVTVTLPDRVLELLATIDKDRARAIVKTTEAVYGSDPARLKPVELVEMSPGKSLIVVGPSQSLARIPWLKLIEIAPGRYLLIVPPGTPIESLEIALMDTLGDTKAPPDEREQTMLKELIALIGHQRRSKRMSKAEILIVDSN